MDYSGVQSDTCIHMHVNHGLDRFGLLDAFGCTCSWLLLGVIGPKHPSSIFVKGSICNEQLWLVLQISLPSVVVQHAWCVGIVLLLTNSIKFQNKGHTHTHLIHTFVDIWHSISQHCSIVAPLDHNIPYIARYCGFGWRPPLAGCDVRFKVGTESWCVDWWAATNSIQGIYTEYSMEIMCWLRFLFQRVWRHWRSSLYDWPDPIPDPFGDATCSHCPPRLGICWATTAPQCVLTVWSVDVSWSHN